MRQLLKNWRPTSRRGTIGRPRNLPSYFPLITSDRQTNDTHEKKIQMSFWCKWACALFHRVFRFYLGTTVFFSFYSTTSSGSVTTDDLANLREPSRSQSSELTLILSFIYIYIYIISYLFYSWFWCTARDSIVGKSVISCLVFPFSTLAPGVYACHFFSFFFLFLFFKKTSIMVHNLMSQSHVIFLFCA